MVHLFRPAWLAAVLIAAGPIPSPSTPTPPTTTPASSAPPAGASTAVHYLAPVEGRAADPFRPPANPYAAGNRGVDYTTTPGAPVKAAAAGTVTFAGQVGGSLDVVVVHADRLRTTYAGLATLAVAAGDQVVAGQALGTSAASLHFGVRAGDAYLDPAVLLDDRPRGRAHLVAVTVAGR